MMETFQIGEKRQPKRPWKDVLGTNQDPRDKTSAREKKLTDEAIMNIACDNITTETTAAALRGEEPYSDTVMELPYVGSWAMLRIKQTWISSKYKAEIYKARRTGPMRIYCAKRHGWTDAVFDMVSWDTVGRVQLKLTHTKQMQTCKIMHVWLPTAHMRQYITGINQYPGCKYKDETILHLF